LNYESTNQCLMAASTGHMLGQSSFGIEPGSGID